MIAGLLRLIGIPMGERIDRATNEDLDFRDAQRSIPTLRQLIRERNERFNVWGWKDPLCYTYFEDILSELRNPHIIAIFRDPVAVALREQIAMRFDFLKQLEAAIQGYSQIAFLLKKYDRLPSMCVSYDKSLRNSSLLVDQLCQFLGISLSQETLQTVATYIRPNRVSGDIHAERWRAKDREYHARLRAAGDG